MTHASMHPTNRLAAEPSPYLRQHAANPVDWHPWGPEALAKARAQRKPILLSIGYSACHWCHVMAHESFEDAATAALMNRLYVNVKVDREERPDLDHLYQSTHRLLNPHSGGGWPLTVFMTPEGVPFFSGTYFPREPRHGLPAFGDLLERAAAFYRDSPGEITQLGAALRDALARESPAASASDLPRDRAPIEQAVATLAAHIDPVEGGFGGARTGPKFPQPQRLALGLAHAPSRELVLLTLRRMADGGIYDHVGGGFCRYSVDAQWTIPHFEKMLYDNAALLALYADAYCVTGERRFAQVVEETVAWAQREMRAPAGGFFSALDADSEGEEGRFYVWSQDEIGRVLAPAERAIASAFFGLDRPPNFEGAWHLRVTRPLDDAARAAGLDPAEAARVLDRARAKLLQARSGRVRPGLDDKILTSWNALMVRGLARAARVFDRADWLALAQATMDFLRTRLSRDGVLHATWQAGGPRLRGYLDDAAFLLDAAIELMQAQFRRVDLDFARALARMLLDQYEDKDAGGFYFTAHDHEPLLHRGKPVEDNATPSGNGVAAFALQRLAHLTGDLELAFAAQRALTCFAPYLRQAPHAVPSLLAAFEESLDPPRVVVLRGPAADLPAWQCALAREFDPHRLVLAIAQEVEGLPPTLAHHTDGTVAAWLCIGTTCLPPIDTLERLRAALAEASR